MIFWVFIFGLVFGSFLNVVIYRLKTRQNIVFGGSFCPECKNKLKWYDLIPILSFLYLRGSCRYCHHKISWQYPIVEILSALLWVGVFYKVFGFQPPLIPLLGKEGLGVVLSVPILNFLYYIFIFSALLVIAVYDFKWQIIPDKIIYPAIAVALIYNLFNSPLDKGGLGGGFNIYGYFLTHLFIALGSFLFFFSLFYFSKGRAMGLGDAKLAFLIGLFLGPFPALAAFVLAFVVGAVFGIMLMAVGDKTLKSKIAFGPFLIFGSVIAFFLFEAMGSLLNFYY